MTNDRIHESDLYIPILRLLSEQPNGFLTTSELIERLEKIFNIPAEDAEILDGRNDTKFSQKVRNIIAHRDTSHSIIRRGFAKYDKENNGLHLTDAGKAFLNINGIK